MNQRAERDAVQVEAAQTSRDTMPSSDVCLDIDRVPDADRTLVTAAGFCPSASQSRARASTLAESFGWSALR